MHRIEYLPIANDDIMQATYYISHTLCAPQAAENMLEKLDDVIDRIAEFPYAYELYHTTRPMTGEIRKVPVKGYVLYYAVFEAHVEIRRFLHGHKDRSNLHLHF